VPAVEHISSDSSKRFANADKMYGEIRMYRRCLFFLASLVVAGCLSPLTTRLDDINARMARMNDQVDETNRRLAQMEAQIEMTNQKLTTVEKGVKQIPGFKF
jgi:outer membrane murein-binding lipoprotein Lpp